jgi:hypothetical protein
MLSSIGGFSGGVTQNFLTANYYTQQNINNAYGPFAKYVNGIITPADPDANMTDFRLTSGLWLPVYNYLGSTWTQVFDPVTGAMTIANPGPEAAPTSPSNFQERFGVRCRAKFFGDATGKLTLRITMTVAVTAVLINAANNNWHCGIITSNAFNNAVKWYGAGVQMSGPTSVSHLYCGSISISSFETSGLSLGMRGDTAIIAPYLNAIISVTLPFSYYAQGGVSSWLPDGYHLLYNKGFGDVNVNDTSGGNVPHMGRYFDNGLDIALMFVTQGVHQMSITVTRLELLAGYMALGGAL